MVLSAIESEHILNEPPQSDKKERGGQGWLKHGNKTGTFLNAPRCGAKTRRGTACQYPAMPNGRCRLHGGLSTGARTAEGRERSRRGNWKHGNYSQAAKQEWRELRELYQTVREVIREYRPATKRNAH